MDPLDSLNSLKLNDYKLSNHKVQSLATVEAPVEEPDIPGECPAKTARDKCIPHTPTQASQV